MYVCRVDVYRYVLDIIDPQTGLQTSEPRIGDSISIENVEQKENDQDGERTKIDFADELLFESDEFFGCVVAQNFGNSVGRVGCGLQMFESDHLLLLNRSPIDFHEYNFLNRRIDGISADLQKMRKMHAGA
jgi:hypothetical protein